MANDTTLTSPTAAGRKRSNTELSTVPSSSDLAPALSGVISVLRVKVPPTSTATEQIDEIAASVLAWHLRPVARTENKSPGHYVIHFETLGEERAAIRVNNVRQALLDRLQEECSEAGIEIAVLTGKPVPPHMQNAVAEYVDGLFERLEAQELGATAQWEGKQRSARKDAPMVFIPAWNPKTQVTDISHCSLDLSLRSSLMTDIEKNGKGAELCDIRTSLDLMALRKCLLAIYKSKTQLHPPHLILPVTTETISNQHWSVFAEQIAEAPDDIRKRLIIEISQDACDPETLTGRVENLTKLDVRTIITVEWLDPIGSCVAKARPFGIAVKLAEAKQIDVHQLRWLHGVPKLAERVGAHALAKGVNTYYLGLQALEGGYTFMSGSAIHLPLSQPRPGTRLKPFQTMRRGHAA